MGYAIVGKIEVSGEDVVLTGDLFLPWHGIYMETVNFSKLSKKDQELIDAAEEVLKNAYDPYSQFYVGSAILTTSGLVFKGVNINTCAYTSICAERAAISNAITNGEYIFEKIAVIARSDHSKIKINSGPCGICRQMLWEFAELRNSDIGILVSDSDKEKVLVTTIKEMHPLGFGPRLGYGRYERYLGRKTSRV